MNRITIFTGLCLIITGIIGLTATSKFLLSKWLLGGGIFLFSFGFSFMMMNLKKDMRGQSVKYTVNTLVYSVIFILILGAVNFISYKRPMRYDLTQNDRFTLSPQTKQVVKNLSHDLEITVFVADSDGLKPVAQDLIDQYTFISNKVKLKFVDLNKRHDIASKLKVSKYRTTVLQYRNKMEKIEGVIDETILTNNIIKLTREEEHLIFFLEGHNEKDPFVTDNSGLSKLKDLLSESGYLVTKLLIKDGIIPEKCKLLAIVGPSIKLLPREEIAIEEFVDRGGALLLCLDPKTEIGLKNLLDKLGIDVTDTMIVDKAGQEVSDSPLIPVVVPNENHPIVNNMNVVCAFPAARCIREKRKFKNEDYDVETFLKTHPNSFAEKDYLKKFKFDGGTDIYGPVSLGISLEKKKKTSEVKLISNGRIVIVGDSDFLANGTLYYQGTYLLAKNIFYWLTDNSDLIAIDSKDWVKNSIKISKKQKWAVFWVVIFLIPSLFILFGIYIYLRGKA